MGYVPIEERHLKQGTLIRITDAALHDEEDTVEEHGYLWLITDDPRHPGEVWEEEGGRVLYDARSLATGYVYQWYTEEFEHADT